MTYAVATTVADAVAAMAAGARPIAGGSDLVVGARHGKAPLPAALVAIHRLHELSRIATTPDGDRSVDGAPDGRGSTGLRVGALATHAALMIDPLVVSGYTALADACALVGSPATRNVGTLGGNVMNASPAMDTGAPLMVLGALVELTSIGGTRLVHPTELWTGPGRTSARADELCTALLLGARPPRSGSAYVRLEYRRSMEIAVVGAAASVTLHDASVAQLSVALTSVAPTIRGLSGLDALRGMAAAELGERVAELASEQAAPISDLRGSDRYRRHCVGVMAARAVRAAVARASGEAIAVPVNRSSGIGATLTETSER